MFEIWSEIFITPSDKARLITILLSSVVAIGIFILNQRFIDRRSRNQVTCEKIEELYLASIDYVNSVHKMLYLHNKDRAVIVDGCSAILDIRDEHEAILLSMNNSIKKMEMLCGLYFPFADIPFHEYGIKALPYIERPFSHNNLEGERNIRNYNISLKHAGKAEDALGHLCNKLMRKQSEGVLNKLLNKFRQKYRQNVTQIKSKWNPL